MDALKDLANHPTAEEIFTAVKQRLPSISLATVYRNLEIMSNNGLIKKLELEDQPMRFDWRISEHYHLTCVKCGRVEDVEIGKPDDPFDILERSLGNLSKYGIFGHRLEFFGLCSQCREKGENLDETLSKR